MSYDLVMIKEKYGERMMHLCRKLFPTLLEVEGQLFGILKDNFVYSKFLYEDLVRNSLEDKFRNYIYELVNNEERVLVEVEKTPEELLSDAGYVFYECKTEEDIQFFTKYYETRERLCTFRGDRLDECYVFFAVKKNIDKIKRNDFMNPERQDEYGTSVISIQFTRGKVNTLSIKNRYNHTVNNPDATYSNNLENIIPGLTRSFEREYNLNINQNESGDFEIPGYVKAKDGRYYKYNYEINNIYYCPGNIIIDNFEIIDEYQEKEKYIMIDYFILDLINKKISLYDKSLNDSFIEGLYNIKKIDIDKIKDTNTKVLKIFFEDGSRAYIEIDKCNRIISYSNVNILNISNNFLYKNKYIKSLNVPNVITIGDDFLSSNNTLTIITLPNILKIGSNFLYRNNAIGFLNFSKLLEVGDNFLCENRNINSIKVPMILKVGNNFLKNNEYLGEFYGPRLSKVGDNFLQRNRLLEEIELSKLLYVGKRFLQYNNTLKKLSLPNLICAGDNFLSANKIIDSVFLPQLKQVGDNFMYCNRSLTELDMEKLEIAGDYFLYCNRELADVNLFNLRTVGLNFLYNNRAITILLVPKLETVGNNFMCPNNTIQYADFSSLKKVGRYFFSNNIKIKRKVLKI